MQLRSRVAWGVGLGGLLLLALVRLDRHVPRSELAGSGFWPQFRGVRASGIAAHQDLPDVWDIGTGTNLRWKTRIPGLGHASPIVSRGCVFVLAAAGRDPDPELKLGLYGDIASAADEGPCTWSLYCLSLSTGRLLWEHRLHHGLPAIRRHPKATHANTTPATDGQHVVVFLGSEGLFCLDFQGHLQWKRDLGTLDSGYFRAPAAQWGFASSPIIFQDLVIVQCDVQEHSFLAAFDLRDGRERWRTPRDDVPGWSTPTVVHGSPRIQLVVNGFRHAGGYDPWTGQPLWQLGGGGDIPVPTPVAAEDLIILSGAHGATRPLCAVRADATGTLVPDGTHGSGNALAWYHPRDGTYMQTPIIYGDYVYACRDNGILSCYELQTGRRMYRERVGPGGTGFTASPVAADGRLYFASEDGHVTVVAAGPVFRQLAINALGEPCMATPAIADGLLICRTVRHIVAVGRGSRPR